MKQIGQDPHVKAGLEILKRLAEKAPDILPFTDLAACRTCQDNGYVLSEVEANGAPCMYSRPCSECQRGRDIAEGIEAARRKSNRTPNETGEDKAEFLRMFTRLCRQFGKPAGGKAFLEVVDSYWDELQYYAPHDLRRGFRHVARTARYFPKISELLDGINGPPI